MYCDWWNVCISRAWVNTRGLGETGGKSLWVWEQRMVSIHEKGLLWRPFWKRVQKGSWKRKSRKKGTPGKSSNFNFHWWDKPEPRVQRCGEIGQCGQTAGQVMAGTSHSRWCWPELAMLILEWLSQACFLHIWMDILLWKQAVPLFSSSNFDFKKIEVWCTFWGQASDLPSELNECHLPLIVSTPSILQTETHIQSVWIPICPPPHPLTRSWFVEYMAGYIILEEVTELKNIKR